MILSAGLLSAQPLHAPNAAGTSPAPSGKPGTVEGVVTNSVNGEPVRKAIVTLQGNPNATFHHAMTDAAGHFQITGVDPGSYFVQAARDGFAEAQRGNRRPKSVTVAEEENVKGVAVQLIPMAHVSGHVLDEDGDPIMLANVQALRYIYSEGQKQLSPAGFANSNDLGEFQFLNLEPGRYYFRANAQQRTPNLPPRTRFSGQQMAFSQTYYPSGADRSRATVADVAPGAEVTNIDFRLQKVPAFHVRGKVVDESAQPARNANVLLESEDAGTVSRQVASLPAGADGTFDLPAIVPGTYVLSASRGTRMQAYATEYARATITVSDQDLNGVGLMFSKSFSVTGRFSVEGQAPVQMNGQVILRCAQICQGTPQADVAQDGTFVISNALPGSYLIDVYTGAPGLYVKSIRFGDSDLASGLVNLQPGSAGALNIVFGTDGGQVHGTAQTSAGMPAANATVTLAPAEDLPGRRDLFKQTGTDANGNFQFQDVAPGEYKVFAWDAVDMNVVQNFDFRKALASHAASVSIAPNGRETVQVQLISADDAEREKNKLL